MIHFSVPWILFCRHLFVLEWKERRNTFNQYSADRETRSKIYHFTVFHFVAHHGGFARSGETAASLRTLVDCDLVPFDQMRSDFVQCFVLIVAINARFGFEHTNHTSLNRAANIRWQFRCSMNHRHVHDERLTVCQTCSANGTDDNALFIFLAAFRIVGEVIGVIVGRFRCYRRVFGFALVIYFAFDGADRFTTTWWLFDSYVLM